MAHDPVESPWIAARFDRSNFPSEFVLGDGLQHGDRIYINYKLKKGKKYRAFIRAYTINNVSIYIHNVPVEINEDFNDGMNCFCSLMIWIDILQIVRLKCIVMNKINII